MKPTRRDILKWGSTGLLAAGLTSAGCRLGRRPNVLLISIDDLNNWVGCLGGHPDALTPNIDAFAATGRLFKHAYSPGTNCNATRTAVLMGLRPWTSGVHTNKDPFPAEHLPGSIPAFFRDHGYRVLGGGKIFHEVQPTVWQEFFTPEVPDLFGSRTAPKRYGFTDDGMLNWGPVSLSDDEMWDGQLVNWAVEKLASPGELGGEQPFFLAVGLFEPHLPWLVPRRYFRPFPPAKVHLPEVLSGDRADLPMHPRLRSFRAHFLRIRRSRQWRRAVASYLAASYFADTMFGRVLAALEAGGHADDTIVVLWSDHGFNHGQKESWHKYQLWEQATQIPFIVRSPGVAKPGVAAPAPVDLMHLYPTLADLCGLERPEHVEGESLVPLLRNPAAEWSLPAITTADFGSHAVRDPRWRYIRYNDGSEELYDHQSDPLEWTNLAQQELYHSIKQRLRAWMPAPAG